MVFGTGVHCWGGYYAGQCTQWLGLTMSGDSALSEFADDEHRAQAEELLLELGRFAVAFERICEGMRHAVLCIFESEGLLHQRLAQVVIGDKASAELQVLLGALFAELPNRTDKADQCCSGIVKGG